jgi:hypothetical protein
MVKKKEEEGKTTIIRKPLNSLDLKGWLIGIPAFFLIFILFIFRFTIGIGFLSKVEILKRPFK